MSEIISFNYHDTKISLIHGDITSEPSQAIVNAANNSLILGAGVAGAIRINGGPEIQKECDAYVSQYGRVSTGDVALTGSGLLKSKGIQYVLHAVGPVWGGGNQDEPNLLKNCILNSLDKYRESHKIESISIPAISSGIFGFPKDLCAKILIATAMEFLDRKEKFTAKVIRFTNFDETTVKIFESEMKRTIENLKNEPEKEKLDKTTKNNKISVTDQVEEQIPLETKHVIIDNLQNEEETEKIAKTSENNKISECEQKEDQKSSKMKDNFKNEEKLDKTCEENEEQKSSEMKKIIDNLKNEPIKEKLENDKISVHEQNEEQKHNKPICQPNQTDNLNNDIHQGNEKNKLTHKKKRECCCIIF